jgi:hypothetical protein
VITAWRLASAWDPQLKAGFEALLGRCQRNRLSPEDHLDVDQVAFSYPSARGLPSLRPTSISLTDTITIIIPKPSLIWGRPRNQGSGRFDLPAHHSPSLQHFPTAAFYSTIQTRPKQHNEEGGYNTCIIPQNTGASGHHGLRQNTTRPA